MFKVSIVDSEKGLSRITLTSDEDKDFTYSVKSSVELLNVDDKQIDKIVTQAKLLLALRKAHKEKADSVQAKIVDKLNKGKGNDTGGTVSGER